MDKMTLTLNSPITEEQWDAITDVDFEHTNEITFHTKHGKTVKFVKTSAQQWIPCEKELPKEREWVLCSCRANSLEVLRLNDTGDWEQIYPNVKYMSGFVLAWMPLPEPYKGEVQ